jgi:hypothetical protein
METTTIPHAYETYHFYCPEMDVTEPMLAKLITGEASARLCYSSDEDSERMRYHLSDWQRQLYADAKQCGVLVNPTTEIFTEDALHNVWKADCSLSGRPCVEVRIAPQLIRAAGPLGYVWRNAYTVAFEPPNQLWGVDAAGLDELRLLVTLFTDDDATNDGRDLDTWGKSYVSPEGQGQLVNLQPTDAIPVARQALMILERFTHQTRRRG